MASVPGRVCWWCVALLVATGCQHFTAQTGKSPLRPLQMSSDSVVLDVFFVRFPYGQSEPNGPLWEEIDEQHFEADARQRLAKNGFRVGRVSGQVPIALSQLLELSGKPAPGSLSTDVKVANLGSEPRVVRRHLQLRANHRTELICSDVYDQLPLLMAEADGVCGKTYEKAQGVLLMTSHPEGDGRIRLTLTPELQYGEAKQRFVGNLGMMRLEVGRSKKAFDDLTMNAVLAPGQMLVLSSLTSRSGSLGHYFFYREDSGKTEQKLLVIRLSQTQQDNLFDPKEPLPLDKIPAKPEEEAATKPEKTADKRK